MEQRLREITFLDIETIPRAGDLEEFKELYHKKFSRDIPELIHLEEHFMEHAGLYAEFGKIINISVGKVTASKLFVKSIAYEDEVKILRIFIDTLGKLNAHTLCAHNGREFDFPWLKRRMLVLGIKVPDIMNTYGKKPWETSYEDTMDMWGDTQFKYKCSLDLLAKLFGLPSPKQSMTGEDVFTTYNNQELSMEERLKRISEYGSGDVVTLVNVWCKLQGIPTIAPENVEYVRA